MALIGLRTLLAASVGGIGLLFTVGTAILLESEAEKRMSILIQEQLQEYDDEVAGDLDHGMSERYSDLLVASSLDTIRSTSASVAEKRAVLNRMKETFPAYAWIGFIEPSGIVTAATNGVLEGFDANARGWWKQALERPYVGDVHDAIVLATLLYPSDSTPPRFLDFAAPVHGTDGKVLGVIAAHLSWDWTEEVQRSVLDDAKQSRGIEGMILSKDGTVILGPIQLLGRKLSPSQMEVTGTSVSPIDFDGEEYLTSIVSTQGQGDYLGLGWRVAVRQPMSSAMLPVRELRDAVMIAGAVLSVAAVLLGLALAVWIARPLRGLSKAVEQRRRGLTGTMPVTSGYKEITTLSDAVGTYLNELNSHERRLVDSLNEKERLLKEKTTLVREIHHRVKNNLQIILSLMLVEKSRLKKNPTVSGADRLEALAGRVNVMGRLHDQFYKSENLAFVDLASQIEMLCDAIADNHHPAHENASIAIRVDADPVICRVEMAMPIGLLVNELVSNALRHAFPNGASGNIEVTLKGGDTITLRVADDGVGCGEQMPEGGIGGIMIAALTIQLNGKIQYRSAPGCVVDIAIPRETVEEEATSAEMLALTGQPAGTHVA
ncbi:hypothetical protein N825_18145 [Skermanella stibiiresistens SB22]|uniref:histidine kinase n=2 Tax=Skermanella TaxID=204447 RepID=W9H8E5_9PROT|nr:hypothetical protein N825_18145 [Skermanella stibiiresistens SB22]